MSSGELPPDIVHQDPDVAMFTAPNPGPKTLSGTHTYVVGKKGALVIDPGPASPEYQYQLASSLRALDIDVAAILLSHGHPDHAPGARLLKDFLGVPVMASPCMSSEDADAAGVDRFFVDSETFESGSDTLQVLAAPGHTRDQVAFWMPRSHILFTGDTILGSGSTLIAPPEGDMGDYMETLERLDALQPRLILPGHGPVVSEPAAKIAEYVAHRRDREKQLVQVLADSPGTVSQLVARLYADTDVRLHGLARGSVEAQLEKLTREGKVGRAGEIYFARLD